MNKHVGITLSVFLLVLCSGARGTDHPPFSNFLFTNLFSIKFLYFFLLFHLFFPYFNLFVSIFIQSYANMIQTCLLLRFFTVNYALRLNLTILRLNKHRFFKIHLYRKGHIVIDPLDISSRT